MSQQQSTPIVNQIQGVRALIQEKFIKCIDKTGYSLLALSLHIGTSDEPLRLIRAGEHSKISDKEIQYIDFCLDMQLGEIPNGYQIAQYEDVFPFEFIKEFCFAMKQPSFELRMRLAYKLFTQFKIIVK